MDRSTDRPARPPRPGLLNEVSLEITGKDAEALRQAAPLVDSGTRINVTYLASEEPGRRIEAARLIRELGLRPVPHVSARRLRSHQELEEYLAALARAGASEEIFVVGGDPSEPEGPFPDALSVITSGVLTDGGVRHVGIAGYPEGHPKIDEVCLQEALAKKWAALQEQGIECAVTTQFGFDSAAVLTWTEQLRESGITCPVRVGVPGPAGVQRLLRYARRFGARSSAGIVQKYGFSLTGLLRTAGPDRFIEDLAAGLDVERHGEVSLHFYTFGGVQTTAEWITTARTRPGEHRAER